MTKTKVIRVFSFIMALTLVFAMFSSPSYAISPRQFGAWVASALTALNITYQSTVAPYYNFIDYISDPFQISQGVLDYVPLQYPSESIDDYLKQSTISFTGDYIEIDGKHYQDIWLSNAAAEKFRVNAFDIKSAFDIASNSNGTYVSGEGYINSVPIYNVNGLFRTQNYSVPANDGNYTPGLLDVVVERNTAFKYSSYRYKPFLETAYRGGYYNNWDKWPWITYQAYNPNTKNVGMYARWNTDSGFTDLGSFSVPDSYVNLEPFDFDWVSGTIPADQQLAPTDGMHLYVPVDPSEWSDSPETQTIINNYNTYINNNPDITPDVDLNLNTDGLLNKIGDLLDILGPIIDLLKPQFGPQNQKPTPPVPTGNTISETPWESLVEWLNRILNKLDDILGIRDILNNFKSAFDSAISSVLNWLSQIISILNSILDAISDLVDTIVHGNVDWFSDIVDAIKKPFLKWLDIFKAGVSIWHYVVEWLQNVSAPFSFFWNVLSSSYSIYLSPFYAVAAASIVIAIYRRFGR